MTAELKALKNKLSKNICIAREKLEFMENERRFNYYKKTLTNLIEYRVKQVIEEGHKIPEPVIHVETDDRIRFSWNYIWCDYHKLLLMPDVDGRTSTILREYKIAYNVGNLRVIGNVNFIAYYSDEDKELLKQCGFLIEQTSTSTSLHCQI